MNRSDITKAFFTKNEKLLDSIKTNQDYFGPKNPAVIVHQNLEERPFTREDFERKEFHMNLISQD